VIIRAYGARTGFQPVPQPVFVSAIDLECNSGSFGPCWPGYADAASIFSILRGVGRTDTFGS